MDKQSHEGDFSSEEEEGQDAFNSNAEEYAKSEYPRILEEMKEGKKPGIVDEILLRIARKLKRVGRWRNQRPRKSGRRA